MTAIIHSLKPKREPSLEPMLQLVAADMHGVNAVILERMQSKVALIPELAGHLIAGGGKRMRPMLTLACAELLGYPGTRAGRLALPASRVQRLRAVACSRGAADRGSAGASPSRARRLALRHPATPDVDLL